MFQSGAVSSDSIANRCCDSGWIADAPFAERRQRRLLQLLHRAPPLERDQRLDPRSAPLAGRDRVPVGSRASRAGRARAAKRGPARPPRPGSVRRASPASSFISPSGPITVSSGKPWSRPISKSFGVVAGRHLQRARTELGLHPLVGDDRYAALDDRDDDLLPDEIRGSARRPDAPRRRRRRGSSPDGRWRS